LKNTRRFMIDAAQEWREAAAFLAASAAYGQSDPVEVIDTSISRVFLSGVHAYKIKKPIKLGFLDFSNPGLRETDCRREVALNRRTAPTIYLGVVAITREADGTLALDGTGMAVEWAVKMRRFENRALLDRMARDGALTSECVARLAHNIAAFHAAIPPQPEAGGAEIFRRNLLSNDAEYRNFSENIFSSAAIDALRDASLAALDTHAPLMNARKAAGWVRHCHGDLHLGNIFVNDGEPTPFDCITFNDAIAKIDVLYDLAFLLMDLWLRGLGALANHCLNQYVAQLAPDNANSCIEALSLLPLFLSCRAGIRAFVMARTSLSQPANAQLISEAHNFFTLAQNFLRPAPPQLIAISGFSGSGKSVLARALAPGIGAAPGALILRSDEIRKQLAGAPLLEHLPQSAYTPQSSAQVYACILKRAQIALQAGHCVIADAVYAHEAERAAIAAVAHALGVPFQGLWLDARAEILAHRVGTRRGDASDATADIVHQQLQYDTGHIGWTRIDAGATPDATFASAKAFLASGPVLCA
jgi:aminoglycoside phosphotransferase family enzyme/cytidylate kinase